MGISAYPDINALLDDLLSNLRAVLQQQLVGVYLHGSLVLGDFAYASSDIDILVATSSDIDHATFDDLHRMHDAIAEKYSQWNGRIEVAYLSRQALQTFKARPSRIAMISPGELFNLKDAGREYLINWWGVREKGLTLFGPPPATIIVPISRQEFLDVVREHVRSWSAWIDDVRERPAQAYAILTLCRALYATTHGEQVSKKQAARWAQTRYPQWAALIQHALAWRAAWRDHAVDHAATRAETRRFVQFMIAQLSAA